MGQMSRHYFVKLLASVLCVAGIITGCSHSDTYTHISNQQTISPAPTLPLFTEVPRSTAAPEMIFYRVSPAVPAELAEQVVLRKPFVKAESLPAAELKFVMITPAEMENGIVTTRWLYALVAPFPTITDSISSADIKKAWRGGNPALFSGRPLLVSPETETVFSTLWGSPDENGVRVLPADQLLDEAWKKQPAWALIPFNDLEPRWKVLAVDGQTPLDRSLDAAEYPLSAMFGFTGRQDVLDGIQADQDHWVSLPASNRDPEKMIVLVMTGTTALARGTAERMETMGIPYPGEKIRPWLVEADLAHISNEIPFSQDCPPAVPVRTDWNFCSDPAYIELLEYIGADIIELTGNHVMDWGVKDFLFTLDLYRQKNFLTYGGGSDLSEARQALLVENRGNKLAFLGCNQPGPEYAWATADSPGSAPCDRAWMADEVRRLTAQGYLVIVTFQHIEVYDYLPVPPQRGDFQAMAEAGAVIVSGSQSHFPQGMSFFGDAFLHYGLGNLFFDQMDEPIQGTRREFIDRHVIYEGRHISTQLLTAMLEDHAQPRPMTPDEREALLRDAFNASTW